MAGVKSCCSLKRKRPPRIEIPSVLRDDQTDIVMGRWKGRDLVDEEEDGFCGNGVAVLAVKGKKKFMEDAHRVVCLNKGDSRKGFFGVYDGHGGKKAAEFVAANLHTRVLEMIESGDENCIEEAIRGAFLNLDKEFLDQGIGSGACCVTAIVDDKEIVVSNLGDCRAVLCRGGVAEALTTDHRAACENEKERIQKEGGYVEYHRGAWRVHGVLSVSRSIGDAHLKKWVSAEPETKILQLSSDMSYLILASDGLWDQVSNQEVADIVMRLCSQNKRLGSPGHLWKTFSDQYGATICTSPSPKIKRVSLLKPQDSVQESPTFSNKSDQEGIEIDFSRGHGTPKTRRILSIVKTPRKAPQTLDQENVHVNLSPHSTASLINGILPEEDPVQKTENPPFKLRRISASRKTLGKLTSSPNQENISPKLPLSAGLVSACREMVNLAVKRGSMDDISVMVIDLNCFRSNC